VKLALRAAPIAGVHGNAGDPSSWLGEIRFVDGASWTGRHSAQAGNEQRQLMAPRAPTADGGLGATF